MEITALCLQICLNVFVLLLIQLGQNYAVQIPAFPVITPDRLQFFEYESVFVNCGGDKGMNAWKVMRKLNKMTPLNISEACSTPAPSCTIRHTFQRHSGEYWCENEEGIRSRSVNIAVTAGPVILNISAQPVREGSDVTLGCIDKNTERVHISHFYKNGLPLTTYYKLHMTLSKVSKSDEGLYKCKISHEVQSLESWLAVVKLMKEKESVETHYLTPEMTLLLRTMAFLFLLIGVIIFMRYYGRKVRTASIGQYSSEQQPICFETSI